MGYNVYIDSLNKITLDANFFLILLIIIDLPRKIVQFIELESDYIVTPEKPNSTQYLGL